MHTSRRLLTGLTTLSVLALAACGGGSSGDADTVDLSNDRGSLVKNPPTQLAALTNTQFSASLGATDAGKSLLTLTTGSATGTVKCGIDVRYIQYGTVGGAGEKTNASGALMIPTGGAGCTGPRPVVVYAHGTTLDKNYNIALLGSTNSAASEAGLVAAMYAAKGYIVVAPNYAGYEASTLGYHPYLNADQSSKDMIDALTAARKAIARIGNGTSDNGKLFLTGYSQGGHVAMATQRAMQAAGMTVTGLAGGSGPYAMSTFIDAIFGGQPILGGTLFLPLLSTSWQKAYGNVYGSATATAADFYTSTYATGIETLLPSTTAASTLVSTGKLPQLALFGNDLPVYNAASPFSIFYGTPAQSLIKSSYALPVLGDLQANACAAGQTAAGVAGCTPAHPVRVAAKTNDLRTYLPTSPVLMCGGANDPTVFYVNAQLTQAYVQGRLAAASLPSALSTLVNVDEAPTSATDPFAVAKGAFLQTKAGIGAAAAAAAAAAGGDATAQATASASAISQNYHATVAPFCAAAAEGFFSKL